ncbi:MAG: hypothetical protein AB7L66_12780 [Gemmatimonadales bacterium]
MIEIRRSAHRLGYYPIARIARANGVTYRTLKDALTGKTYRHCDKVAAPFHGPTSTGPKGSVVRLDHGSTKGWQARYRGASKFFADRRNGGTAKAKAAATQWLQLTRNQAAGV